MHLWHIFRPGEADAVLELTAARIVVAHSGTLIFLDHDQQPIYALAAGAWTSVERVPAEEVTDPAVSPAVDSGISGTGLA